MTVSLLLSCGFCRATSTVVGGLRPDGWGVIQAPTSVGPVRREDICPRCIARLRGWRGAA